MSKQTIPNPETKLGVLKRYLHVLALLQNSNDPTDWNDSSLSAILAYDEPDHDVSPRKVSTYIKNKIEEELDIEVDRIKGGRATRLAEDIDEETLKKVINIYAGFVVTDSSREIVLNNLLKKHPGDSLWMLATVYFAILQKKIITFDYIANSGYEIHNALFHPWHLVFRNNNLYLVGKIHGKDSPWPLIFNRISNLKVKDKHFEEEVPSIDDLFGDSLSAFIGKKYSVTLRFNKKVLHSLEQFLSILEPEFREINDDTCEASFTVSDDKYLCKQLLLYGKDVEIVEPAGLRDTMVKMLEESLSVYK